MSRFKYSSDELDMNKVLKMNQDVSHSMSDDQQMSQTRNGADSNIEASLALLRSLGKGKDISQLSTDIASKEKDRRLEHRPVLESWEEIVAQANLHEPNGVVLEDIMIETEIQSAFAELDSIEEQFSKKTKPICRSLRLRPPCKWQNHLFSHTLQRNLTTEKVLTRQNDWSIMTNLSRKPIRKRIISSVISVSKNTEPDIGSTFFIRPFPMILQKARKI